MQDHAVSRTALGVFERGDVRIWELRPLGNGSIRDGGRNFGKRNANPAFLVNR